MEKNNEANGFRYTYSAKEQEELKRIRAKYTDDGENKMDRIRRLDACVTQKAQVVSLVLGVLGALILGLGMSLFLSDFGARLGLGAVGAMALGIVIGVIGGVLAALAYPAYQFVITRERQKIAPEILRLTEELLK